jgi:hypothetical protein
MINDIMGSDFDYLCLPVHGAAGGVLIAWRSDLWDGTLPNIGRFSVTIRLRALSSYSLPWWLSNVYGPTAMSEKAEFLQEIRDIHASTSGPWLVCGDFNLILEARYKNNGRLHRGLMR